MKESAIADVTFQRFIDVRRLSDGYQLLFATVGMHSAFFIGWTAKRRGVRAR